MPGTAARIQISEKQQFVLEEFSRSRTIAQFDFCSFQSAEN